MQVDAYHLGHLRFQLASGVQLASRLPIQVENRQTSGDVIWLTTASVLSVLQPACSFDEHICMPLHVMIFSVDIRPSTPRGAAAGPGFIHAKKVQAISGASPLFDSWM